MTAAVGAVVLTALTMFAGPAAAAPQDSVSDFLGCLRGQRSGDLLILFDTTGSLQKNDPANRRGDAAKALVAELGSFATRSSIKLDAAMAGFGWHYQREGEWTDLATDRGRTAMDAAVTTVSGTTSGAFESDFWNALDGAQRDLAAKADQAAQTAPRCQALLWFTDGEYRLAVRKNRADIARYGEFKPYLPGRSLTSARVVDAALRRGTEDICADGGPADRLRSGNVTIWGIGLTPADRPDKPDLKLVRRVAEGDDGETDCGRLRTPPGRYFQVDDADQLRREIWQITNPGAQHLQRFVLDDALTGVAIAARQPGSQGLTLAGPDNFGKVAIPYQAQGEGEAEFGRSGVTASWRWDAPDSVTITVARGPRSWLGVWSILDNDGRPADPKNLQVSFRGDLTPTWPASNELIADETTQVNLGLARGSGADVPAEDVPGTLSLSAELVPAGGRRVPIVSGVTKADLDEPRSLDLTGVRGGAGTVRMTLDYTTQVVDGLSTTLAPSVVITPVTIKPPLDRGEITGPLDFGDIKGRADSTATVSVTGPSCVWLAADGPDLVAPPEVGGLSLSTPHASGDSCLRVDPQATVELPVQLTTTYGGNGTLNGQVVFNLAPEDDPTRPVPVSIDVSARLTNPIDSISAIRAFVVAFVLGLGIPIGLLYLFKWRGARIPGRPLEAILAPVSLVSGEVRHAGQPLIGHSLPAPLPVDLLRKGTRSTNAAGVDLWTRMGARPFGPGFVEAALAGHIGASAASATPHGKARAARLPLAVHNTWAVFHDPLGDPADAKLLLLRGFDLDDAAFEALLADARASIPDRLAGLPGVSQPPTGSARSSDGFALGDDSFGLGGGDRSASASAAPGSGAQPTTPAPADTTGAPDWGSQSFGSFGLGDSEPSDDSAGERKAP